MGAPESDHGIPVKALVIGMIVVIIGFCLLLMDQSSTANNKSMPESGKVTRTAPSVTDDSNISDPDIFGFSAAVQEERSSGRRGGRFGSWTQGPVQPVPLEYKARIESFKSIHKWQDKKTELLQFGRELAKIDLVKGLALIKSLSPESSGLERNELALICQGFFEVAAQANLELALKMSQELSSIYHKAGLGTVMSSWARSDLNAAIVYLGQLPRAWASHGVEAVFSVWGESDPQAALTDALKLNSSDSSRIFRTAVMSVLDGWSNKDPKAVWGYVMNPDPVLKDVMSRSFLYLSGIAAKWAETDFDAAMAAVKSIESAGGWGGTDGDTGRGNDYQHMVEMMTMRLLETNPDAAVKVFDREKWLAGRPWLSSRNVTRLIGEGSVAEAADWMAKIPDQQSAYDCARQVASSKTQSDYDMTFKWASMIPDDYVKAGALGNIANEQARHDIDRPIDWIYDLPPGQAKDQSVAGFVMGDLRRVGDRKSEAAVKQQMAKSPGDMAGIADIIQKSTVTKEEQDKLMSLVLDKPPPKPLIVD